jgi:hypothetical protein
VTKSATTMPPITDAVLPADGQPLAGTERRVAPVRSLGHPALGACPVAVRLVAAKVSLLFAFAWHSRFVMDEFVQFGWAKYLGNGLFDTIWHAKAVGYVLFYKLAHLVGTDAVSTLLVGRMQVALLACATIAIIYGCARAPRA